MDRRLHLLHSAAASGALDWPLAQRALASEWRYRLLRPALVRALSTESLALLPEAAEPDFLASSGSPSKARAGDPIGAYWSDLRQLRPTTRQEEFVLTRAVDLLRETLVQMMLDQPHRAGLALLQEHLSSYSSVLERLKEADLEYLTEELDVAWRDRLHQRLHELRAIQDALVSHVMHLVPAVARKYSSLGVPWEDLVQEGNTALLRAVERYDRNEGVRFSGYAVWWIQQGILKALSFQSRTVRLPVYLAQALHRVREAQAASPETLSVDTLAESTRLKPERVERAMRADRACLSIDRSGRDDEESPFVVEDPREPVVPDLPSHEELRGALEQVLDQLPPREALVLRLRFGLEGGRVHTLDEVRQVLGISRERVRQLQAQSLRRLSRPTPKRRLAKFVA